MRDRLKTRLERQTGRNAVSSSTPVCDTRSSLQQLDSTSAIQLLQRVLVTLVLLHRHRLKTAASPQDEAAVPVRT